jgi:hypothetical protein
LWLAVSEDREASEAPDLGVRSVASPREAETDLSAVEVYEQERGVEVVGKSFESVVLCAKALIVSEQAGVGAPDAETAVFMNVVNETRVGCAAAAEELSKEVVEGGALGE